MSQDRELLRDIRHYLLYDAHRDPTKRGSLALIDRLDTALAAPEHAAPNGVIEACAMVCEKLWNDGIPVNGPVNYGCRPADARDCVQAIRALNVAPQESTRLDQSPGRDSGLVPAGAAPPSVSPQAPTGDLVTRLREDNNCYQPTFYKTADECIAAGACSCNQKLHREAANAIESGQGGTAEGADWVRITEKLLSEAAFLLHRNVESCPRWKPGIGDCDLPDCEPCRVMRCAEALDALPSAAPRPDAEERVLRTKWIPCLQKDGSRLLPYPPCWVAYTLFPEGKMLVKYWSGEGIGIAASWTNSTLAEMHYYIPMILPAAPEAARALGQDKKS